MRVENISDVQQLERVLAGRQSQAVRGAGVESVGRLEVWCGEQSVWLQSYLAVQHQQAIWVRPNERGGHALPVHRCTLSRTPPRAAQISQFRRTRAWRASGVGHPPRFGSILHRSFRSPRPIPALVSAPTHLDTAFAFLATDVLSASRAQYNQHI